ncbi:MAG: hypothetical protein AAFQ84_03640, partial [Pseudomonadota bacterium]
TAIIVPTFSANDEIWRDCLALSDLNQCLFIYVNAQYHNSSRNIMPRFEEEYFDSVGLFFCGHVVHQSHEEVGEVCKLVTQYKEMLDQDSNLWYFCAVWRINMQALITRSGSLAGFSDEFRELLKGALL